MIKWFRKQDIIVTDFIYANKKDLNTINNDFKKYNISVDTSSLFQRGEYITGSNIFYTYDNPNWNSKLNPTNSIDKSYKKQVYNEVYNMYYNTYNNAYDRFGFSSYDTSNTILNLADNFIALNFNVYNFGDGIQPKSVNIINYSGDIIGSIYDDGYNNLYLSGSYFIDKNEVTSSDMFDISYGEYGISKIITNDTYKIVKYKYKDVKLDIDFECNPICEKQEYSVSELTGSVNVHFLGLIGNDTFTYTTPFFDFYYNNELITSTKSYEIGDVISIKLKDDFITYPFHYLTLHTDEECANSYLLSNVNTGSVITVEECEEQVDNIYVTVVVTVDAQIDGTFCPDGNEPTLTTSIAYLNERGVSIPTNIKNTITATLTENNYIVHDGDYEYNTTYRVVPSKYTFSSTLNNIVFDIRYIDSTVKTSTTKECGIPDVYDITITPVDISVCEDHTVTSTDCEYSHTPLHNSNDTITVTYTISENSYKINTATVSSSDPSDYEYNVIIPNVSANITYTEKDRIQLPIQVEIERTSSADICDDATEEEILGHFHITHSYYGLRSGDTLTGVTYSYNINTNTNSITASIASYSVIIADENKDKCYAYDVQTISDSMSYETVSCGPETKSIVFIPNNVDYCLGSTPQPNGYTTNPELETGDVVSNDTLEISDNYVQFVQTPSIQPADTSYVYNITTTKGNVTSKDCAETINITFTPNNVTICDGDTPILTYAYSPQLQEGDSISNDELEVSGTTIRFKQTPTVISGNIYSRRYNVITNTGLLTIQNCVTVNPQCPDICAVEGETSSDIETMALSGINSAINYSQLKTNESIKTKDTIKSITYNINVTN